MSGIRAFLIIAAIAGLTCEDQETRFIRMATTTSTENSGLLGHLLPAFRAETGITVRVIAVGSGKAMKLGENGDVDVVLAHSRAAEEEFTAKGFGVGRRDVMYNDFVIAGPENDPAKVTNAKTAAEAFTKIAAMKSPFVSRGDLSGTHVKEAEIWKQAGLSPAGAWYLEAGQGMESVLMMADEKHAYTLADRGTYIAVGGKTGLVIVCEGDSALFNPYGIIAVNPKRHPHVRIDSARRFIEWITSEKGQRLIAEFTIRGQQLFYPNARAVTGENNSHD